MIWSIQLTEFSRLDYANWHDWSAGCRLFRSGDDNYELLGGFWVGGSLCIVNFVDFANFAEYWLQSGSGLPADLYEDSFIDYDDLLEFANLWLCICPYDWQLK